MRHGCDVSSRAPHVQGRYAQGIPLELPARRPKFYRRLTGIANRVLSLFGAHKADYDTLPLAVVDAL